MKKKIAEEIEKLKKFEEEQAAKLKAQADAEAKKKKLEEEAKAKEAKPTPPPPSVPSEIEVSIQSKLMIEKARIEKDREEMRIKSEEARKAAARRERIKKETERLRKESEIARQKAIEEGMKQLHEQEIAERHAKIEAERQKRLEDERKAIEKIRLRKLEDEEREKQAKEEAAQQKLRDQEEAKRIMMENMERKLAAEEDKNRREEEAEALRPKRKSLMADNPFIKRFEEMTQQNEAKEKALEEARLKSAKKKVWKMKSKEVLRMSRLMLAQTLSKEKLATKEGKNLVKAVSKEILRMVSKESLTRKSNLNIKRSKDALRTSLELLRTKSKGQLSKDNLLSPGNHHTAIAEQPSRKDMQNYLVSHLLFDGKEDVQTEQSKRMSKQRLMKKEEDEKKAQQEERAFELYKQEMEKYLDFIGEDGNASKKTKKKKKATKDLEEDASTEKKLLINIGSIKNQFETMASPEIQQENEPKPVPVKKVGRINTKDLFAEQEKEREEEEKAKKKKKEYVPVIIDRAAFERTVGKFAPTQVVEQPEPIKREKKVWLPPELRKAELKQKNEEPEEEESDLMADTELEPDIEQEPESEPEPEPKPEPEPEPEPELTEEERVAKMDIFTRIQYELDKVRKRDEVKNKEIERENKKRELARQIQEQIARIKSLTAPEEPKAEAEETYIPTWSRKYKQQVSSEEKSENQKDEPGEIAKEEKDDTPQWIKLIRERQAQLKEFELLFKKQKQEENARKEQSDNVTEKIDNSKEEEPSFMSKKPEGLKMKTFSSMKEQFESQSTGETTSPTSPKIISPYEINPDRVKMIKEQLLKSREKEKPKSEKKDDGFLAKKCSAIKNKLEQAFSNSNDDKRLAVKMPKKIINVIEEQSIDELLLEKKKLNAERNWSYKQKDLKDLHYLLEANEDVSKTFRDKAKAVEAQTSNILSNRQELLNIQEKLESNEVEEYTELMDRVHSYISTSKTLSPEEQAFRNTIQGYLSLIQDDDKVAVKKKKSKSSKQDQKTMDTLPTRSIQAIKLEMEKSVETDTAPRNNQVIGKLSMPRFDQQATRDDKADATTMGQGYCSSIKDQLLKGNQSNADEQELFVRKMKLVHIEESKSVTESLKELKEQRQYEWKWKKKNIEDLQVFISTNKDKVNIEVPKPELNRNVGQENISYDKQLEDYVSLMDNIKEYLQKDADKSKESLTIKETLCSYLDLVEDNESDEVKEDNKFQWKSLGKVKDRTSQLESTNEPNDDSEMKTVGKINTKQFETQQSEDKPRRVMKTSNYFCDSIISQLEKKSGDENQQPSHISRTMKIVQVPGTESYDEALKHLKARRQEEWKWKQKTIGELNSFLKSNDHGNKITANLETNVKRFNNDSDMMKLRKKSEQLARSIKERDKAMKGFMDDLQDFSNKPCENTNEVAFKEGIKAFLDLIDEKSTDVKANTLPEITSPFKLDSKKSKFLDELSKPDTMAETKKNIGKVDASSFLDRRPSITEKKTTEVPGSLDKTSMIKKFFETTKGSGMSRTMSELSLKPKVKKPKVIIDPMKQAQIVPDMQNLQRRSTVKRQQSIPSYFSEKTTTKSIEKTEPKSTPVKPKSEWDHIQDPEEKKKAILAKYGFKPHQTKDSEDDDPLEDVDTIPSHILNDEILYKKYMQEHVNLQDEDSSSRDSSPDRKRDSKQGSFSSLMNILTTMKKASMQKNAMDSRKALESLSKKSQETRISSSAQDLTNIPGSCQNIRGLFENMQEEEEEYELKRGVQRSSSSSQLGSMWTNHINSNSNNQHKEGIDRSSIKSGIVTNLKEHLSTNSNEKSFELNDPIKRQSLSHLDLIDDNESNSYQSDVRLELEALRSSGQNKSIFKLEHGKSDYENRQSLRRAQSNLEVISSSTDRLDLDDEDMAELKANNRQIKAMFEASAPKYKYGGSGDSLNKTEQKTGKYEVV